MRIAFVGLLKAESTSKNYIVTILEEIKNGWLQQQISKSCDIYEKS